MKQIQRKIFKIVLIVLAAISVLSMCFLIGRYVGTPFNLGVNIDNVKQSDTHGEYRTIIDNSRQRITFCKNNQVLNVIEYSTYNNEAYYFDDVAVSDTGVYIQEFCYIENTSCLKKELIEKFSFDGVCQGIIWSQEYDLGQNCSQELAIKSMICKDNKLIAYAISKDYNKINSLTFDDGKNVHQIAESKTESLLFDVSWAKAPVYFQLDPLTNNYYLVDIDYNLFELDCVQGSHKQIDVKVSYNMSKILSDSSHNIVQEKYEWLEGFIPNEIFLQVRIFLFWASVFYLIVALICLLVFGAMFAYKNKHFKILKNLFVSATVFVCLVVLFAMCMQYINTQKNANYQNFTDYTIEDIFQDRETDMRLILDQYSKDGQIPKDLYLTINKYLERKSIIAAKNDFNITYSLLYNSQELLRVVAQSGGSVHFVDVNLDDFLDECLYDNGHYKNKDLKFPWGENLIVGKTINDDDGKIIGIFVASTEIRSQFVHNRAEQIGILFSFLAIAIAISFAAMEFIGFGKLAVRVKLFNKKKRRENEPNICRLVTFLCVAASSVDSALVVLVAKDMLHDSPIVNNAIMISLPMVVVSIAYLIGNFLFSFLIKRFRARSCTIVCTCLTLTFFAMCALSVYVSNFIMLLVFLLLANLFSQIALLYAQGLPMFIKDENERRKINRECSSSVISGFSLSTLIAGFVAQYIANYVIYLIAVVVLVVLLLVLLIVVPKKSAYDSHKTESKKAVKSCNTQTLKFLFAPAILFALICVNFPYELAGGFKTYLFPLFADGEGLSKATISNIVVFCNALAFYSAPLLNKVEEKLGSKLILILGCLVLGVTFVGFLVNSSILWAIIVLLVTIVVVKIMQPSFASYWQEYAIKHDIDKGTAISVINSADSVSRTVRGPIMGALTNFGGLFACTIMGLYCLVSAGIFALVTNDRNKDT